MIHMNKEKIQTTPGVSIFFFIFIFDRLFQPIIDWSYKDSHRLSLILKRCIGKSFKESGISQFIIKPASLLRAGRKTSQKISLIFSKKCVLRF